MTPKAPDLRATLKHYFGFDTFRPLQEEIIRDALAGKDVFALLPTGGGKSLCFQLPALVRPGLTLVVSPLIALMKDQVDALQASGVAATFLNSSINAGESRERFAKLHYNQYKLLYVAPERLMLSGFLDSVKKWNVQLIAIDEAHCISEWGHDFRPEYRQLKQLREAFPKTPVMALTATATERVREDIVTQLHLRDGSVYVASFNRPNLTYRVFPKSDAYQQLHEFISTRPKDSGIVYCHSRKGAESTAARLKADGIPSRPYHAGMDAKDRAKNQEAFLRDEIRVICATIAFGMGINKPNVRFVVHYDLPKNIESYYQETGRAGRDGLPSECVLLFSPGDAVKQQRFIEEKSPHEQKIARAQLSQMVHYADSSECRRRLLLEYFGESLATDNCGGCDNCLAPRATYDGTMQAQKLLSCVYRIREHSGFGVGLNHVVEVLTGSENERVLKWGHQKISTYGIGKDTKRPEWMAIGRELMRLGYLKQDSARFNVLELTSEGRAALSERRKITLTRPVVVAERKLSKQGDISCDEVLFDRLRVMRRGIAEQRGVPPYIIFSDVTLRQVAARYPSHDRDLRAISGMGEKKREEFGAQVLAEVAAHLKTNARQIFAEDSFTPARQRKSERDIKPKLSNTATETLALFKAGHTVAEIAKQRNLSEGTIFSHLASAIAAGEKVNTGTLLTAAEYQQIAAAFAKHGSESLGPVKQALGDKFDYPVLHIGRALYETRSAAR